MRSIAAYVDLEGPAASVQGQRLLAIPMKWFLRPVLCHLSHDELHAILAASDMATSSETRT